MGADQALDLMNRMLWVSAMVSAPVLGAAMLVGLLISVLQVATQLQESTLSYIPKLVAAGLVMIALGSWMMHQITQFAVSAFKLIPSLS